MTRLFLLPCVLAHALSAFAESDSLQPITVECAGFVLDTNSVVRDGEKSFVLAPDSSNVPAQIPFCQSAVKQSAAPALLGPRARWH